MNHSPSRLPTATARRSLLPALLLAVLAAGCANDPPATPYPSTYPYYGYDPYAYYGGWDYEGPWPGYYDAWGYPGFGYAGWYGDPWCCSWYGFYGYGYGYGYGHGHGGGPHGGHPPWHGMPPPHQPVPIHSGHAPMPMRAMPSRSRWR